MDVVIGRMFENKEEIHLLFDWKPNVRLYENTSSMSLLMNECDLAISANGTTVYELSVMGVPTVSFAMVNEQLKSAEALSRLGAVDYCGRFYQDPEGCINTIIARVEHYMNHNSSLVALGQNARQIIDGYGCRRIVKSLLS